MRIPLYSIFSLPLKTISNSEMTLRTSISCYSKFHTNNVKKHQLTFNQNIFKQNYPLSHPNQTILIKKTQLPRHRNVAPVPPLVQLDLISPSTPFSNSSILAGHFPAKNAGTYIIPSPRKVLKIDNFPFSLLILISWVLPC